MLFRMYSFLCASLSRYTGSSKERRIDGVLLLVNEEKNKWDCLLLTPYLHTRGWRACTHHSGCRGTAVCPSVRKTPLSPYSGRWRRWEECWPTAGRDCLFAPRSSSPSVRLQVRPLTGQRCEPQDCWWRWALKHNKNMQTLLSDDHATGTTS